MRATCEDCDWSSGTCNVLSEIERWAGRHERDTDHVTTVEGEPPERDEYLEAAEVEISGNVFELTGWKPSLDDSVIERVSVATPMSDTDLKAHIEQFKAEVPAGQLRTVGRFLAYLNEEEVDYAVLNREGMRDLTGGTM